MESIEVKLISKNTEGSLSIVLVAGLPGIGKSTLFNSIIKQWTENYGMRVVKIESDIIRQTVMKENTFKPENRHLSPRELELITKPEYTRRMHQQIRDDIQNLSAFKGKSLFILDKNFVPEKLRELIYTAAHDFYESVKSFFLLPVQSEAKDMEMVLENKLVPFHYDTLCASLVRCFSRKGHMSLCHGFSHSMNSIAGVVKAYSGHSFQDIADKYEMKILYFDFFNSKKLLKEPTRSLIKEKMDIIFEMIKSENFDGDLCASLLLTEKLIVDHVCSYEDHAREYARIANEVYEST